MKYGTMESAKEYCNREKVEEWIQLFLRSDGHNIALADGLLKEKRYYTDIVEFDMNLLCDIQAGAPDYLTKENDKVFFFNVVEQMKENMKEWNPPPIIIEYQGNKKFYVCDGRHRLELYRQMAKRNIPAIVWTSGEESYKELIGVITC